MLYSEIIAVYTLNCFSSLDLYTVKLLTSENAAALRSDIARCT